MRRLVLVADRPTVVQAIRVALKHGTGFRVVASVDGRSSARRALSELRPDVVLVDEMCQRTNALARLREAIEVAPDAKVVLLSAGLEASLAAAALDAGADAVVSRNLHAATLGTLLREIVNGNVVHAPRAHRSAAARELAGDRPEPARRAHLQAVVDQPPAARTSA
jgi:DNA-binding NarL/FixJ family response regulator